MPAFDTLWSELEPIGRHAATGGYRRFAWTGEDAVLREWFASAAEARGLDLTLDRAGNQWAWWGDPDAAVTAGDPGVVIGSHLDSVPDGGAFDGPLGVVSAFAAVDALRVAGFTPRRPIGVVNFGDEEGARFGVACAGSRIITGALDADRARGLRDGDGFTMAEAMQRSGFSDDSAAADPETLARIGTFVELHVEQGRALVDLDAPVGLASSIWPHGRWRLDLLGEANHAGTTRLVDRRDPMLALAAVIQEARRAAQTYGAVATVGKVRVEPNGVNAIASAVTAWLDARGPNEPDVRRIAQFVAEAGGVAAIEESFTADTPFDAPLRDRLATALGGQVPVLATGAGHDAGILAGAGIPTAMIFVRNPTGVSHSPAEHAETSDCHAGVEALTSAVRELAS
ncbi:N-carbamoyl-L-amino-acid hydrolase [Frankineae bacterium MT45]|nr:N-carbamoyl-L-amino-acid hydrolase [Frankineae bacterium MT45]